MSTSRSNLLAKKREIELKLAHLNASVAEARNSRFGISSSQLKLWKAEKINLVSALEGLTNQLHATDPCELAIYGVASEGLRLFELCGQLGIRTTMLVDDAKAGQRTPGGTGILSPSMLACLDPGALVVLCTHRVLQPWLYCLSLGLQPLCFSHLQQRWPTQFPPHPFYDGLVQDLERNHAQYSWLHQQLGDSLSRSTLAEQLSFRKTGDPTGLASVLQGSLYHPWGLFARGLRFGPDEVYCDGGAYDGDSIDAFIERTSGSFHRIHAFEPQPASFKRLLSRFSHDDRICCYNAALYSYCGSLQLIAADRHSTVSSYNGGPRTQSLSLDAVMGGSRVSYIKLNIEGSEPQALAGAAETIRRWRPKLAISCYHQPSHLWQLPQQLLELHSDYQLYLRQHDGGIIETVLYAL